MPSELDFKTFTNAMDMKEFVDKEWENWTWWQIVLIPDNIDLMMSISAKYRLFYIVKVC